MNLLKLKNSFLESTLLSRIWTAAIQNPDKLIVHDIEKSWTWQSLLFRAKDYADAIVETCDGPQDTSIIPILVDRTGETIAAILGTLISGRGFAPLNPQQPTSRLQHCFSALNAKVFISTVSTDSLLSDDIARRFKQVIPIEDNDNSCLPSQPTEQKSTQLLYVLFTSGSTGVPKGVVADYSNIENTMMWSKDILNWHSDDVIGCCTNFFFDISMFDIFTTLYFDIPLAIYSNPSNVMKVVEETSAFKITSIFGVPTFFSQMSRNDNYNIPNLSNLRRIISGGDFFPPAHVLRWMKLWPEIEIYNVWGPTETSIVNTMHKLDVSDIPYLKQGRAAPVGKAHPRMQFHLIDESKNILQGANQRGEICMIGACVTRGYLGDAEQTNLVYIELDGQRGFRTRDIGYLDDNENLFIVGRIGTTVKVGGYRIDLREVETAATSLSDVHLACCFVFEVSEGHQELWLAVEPKDKEGALDIYSLKKGLRSMLQSFMVPKRVVVMPELPKNANGKIHRREIAKRAAQ